MGWSKHCIPAGMTLVAASVVSGGSINETYDLTFDQTPVYGLQGDAGNTVLSVNIGINAVITGVGWDLDIETVNDSPLSDPMIGFTDSSFADAGLTLQLGVGLDQPGVMGFNSGGVIDLSDNAISNLYFGDGILLIELFETTDDVMGGADAYMSGTLTLGLYVLFPAPGTAGLFGVAALCAARRRRG